MDPIVVRGHRFSWWRIAGLSLGLLLMMVGLCGSGMIDAADSAAASDDSFSSVQAGQAKPSVDLRQGDVVAFAGGSDVAAALESGHLEALLTAHYASLRLKFRNFGWEGDTVFSQPRDVGFPSLPTHLERAGATVVMLEFGRAEALAGRGTIDEFSKAYQKVLDEVGGHSRRLVLVTPPPFEKAEDLLPDLSIRNSALAQNCAAIRNIAHQRHLPVIDLFAAFGGQTHREAVLTVHGFQLTPRGHALIAAAFARQLGLDRTAERTGAANDAGVWPNAEFEKLRQEIIAKNKLWFHYWRPQNWAFLGGDRTEQPSSRDYRDPRIRWFPTEMEKFVPLIEAREREIARLASNLE